MTQGHSSLSVIVTSTVPLRQAPAVLAAIAAQRCGREVEVILAYGSDDEPTDGLSRRYGDVTVVRLPGGAPLPHLLGAAVARAGGQIIAITDATCTVDEDWVSAILRAHDSSDPVIGGVVEPGGLRRVVDWAAYFCDYGQFMAPLAEGVAEEVPGNNVSVKRWALTRGREFVDREFWKTYWCRHIQSQGLHLRSAPSIVVYYQKSFRLWQYLVHRFHNGRCFAGMRIGQLSWAGRVLHWGGTPLLPLLFCARIVRSILPKRRRLRQFFLALPIVVLATVSWSLGECCGYLLGPGASCRHVR